MRCQQGLTLTLEFVALAVEARVVFPNGGLIGDQIQRKVIGEFHAFKKGPQPEVVGLQQRVKLVIMTPAAGHRESEESTARRLGEIGHQFGSAAVLFVEQPGRVVVRPQTQVTRGDQRILLGDSARRAFQQFIARQLLENKPVEGLVGIEGPDHVVAEPPGPGPELIPIEAIAVAVADDVEPLARLVFSITRRSQQAIDQAFVGRRCRATRAPRLLNALPLEGLNLSEGRRKPGEIECHPPDQSPGIGLGRARAAQPGVQRGIGNRRGRKLRIPGNPGPRGRGLAKHHRPKRPKIKALPAKSADDWIARIFPSIAYGTGRRRIGQRCQRHEAAPDREDQLDAPEGNHTETFALHRTRCPRQSPPDSLRHGPSRGQGDACS